MNIDLGVWGKSDGLPSPYPLAGHSLDAMVFAEALWDEYLTLRQRLLIMDGLGLGEGDEARARALVAWWAGLHDLGKTIPGFQRQDEKAFAALVSRGFDAVDDTLRIGHDRASHLAVPALLLELGDPELSGVRRMAERVGQLLGGHHGVFHPRTPDALDEAGIIARNRGLGDGQWAAQRRALVRGVHGLAGSPLAPSCLKFEAALLITGVVVVSDWLASQESFIRERLDVNDSGDGGTWLAEHVERSRGDVRSWIRRAGLRQAGWREVTFQDAFEVGEPRPFQRSLLEGLPPLVDGPGMLLVTVPTGEGKTEAALMAARLMGEKAGAPGLFVALPTMATADQMYWRVAEYATRSLLGGTGLTLAHSMAWLNDKYDSNTVADDDLLGDGDALDAGESARTAAPEWLRGRRRPLLAPLSVGTVDQVLAAVVKGKHNALRLLGLTGKVLIIDEVHAYDAYMHSLLRRLLHWMGVLGVPVVLLSATLSGEIARQLIGDYLDGSGHESAEPVVPPYPGWVYVDARTGVMTPSPPAEISHPWDLAVDLRRARSTEDVDDPRGRIPALRQLLEPIVVDQGCAAVVCNTVADAQQTYRTLRDWFRGLPDPPELRLLHARFPAWRRAELTDEAVAWFDKGGKKRPKRAVLVATQVIEQSLDLDLDLVISDLAPLALLLQRAGRCWRHSERSGRPSWSTGPRLAVLVPVGDTGDLRLPRRWLGVYPEAMLMRTDGLLVRLSGPINVPGHVQELVDAVYAAEFTATEDPDKLRDADMALWGENAAAQGIAHMVSVPTHRGMRSLADWSAGDVDDDLLTTRLGADSARVLCCYVDEAGYRWLDHERTRRLPEKGTAREGRFTRDELKDLMSRTVPMRSGEWNRHLGPEHQVPEGWTKNSLLRHLVLLPLRRDAEGNECTQLGDAIWRLDIEEGLVSGA